MPLPEADQPPKPLRPKSTEVFGFTDEEALFYHVKDSRFREILAAPDTTIHRIRLDGNNYGEFLFVTISKTSEQGRASVTFFGLGFHQLRERWYTHEWFWYENHPISEVMRQQLSKDEAEKALDERRTAIRPYAVPNTSQSSRAKLFELLADFSDEDAALVELDDFENLVDWLPDDFD